jgi:hypothetical protein
MILRPIPLQPPARRSAAPAVRAAAAGRAALPVLHSQRAPRQLCLDLQPRPR